MLMYIKNNKPRVACADDSYLSDQITMPDIYVSTDQRDWHNITMSPTGNLPDGEAARQGYIPIGDHHCPRGWPAERAHCGVRHREAAGAAEGRPPQQWRLYRPRCPLVRGRGRWRDQRRGMQLRPSRCLVRRCWGHPPRRRGSAAVQLELLAVEQLIGGWLDESTPCPMCEGASSPLVSTLFCTV